MMEASDGPACWNITGSRAVLEPVVFCIPVCTRGGGTVDDNKEAS